MVKKGVPPFGAIFGHLGPKWPQTVNSWNPPVECKVLEKSVSHPYGVRSEAIQKVYFGCTVPLVPKYTLRMASNLTPYGWDTLFSNTLHSAEGLHLFLEDGREQGLDFCYPKPCF